MNARKILICLALAAVAGGSIYWFGWRASPKKMSVDQAIREGEKLIREGEWEKGAGYMTAVLAREPRNIRALHGRALACASYEDFDMALFDANCAVRFTRGKDRKSLILRALIQMKANQIDPALTDANHAIELAKSSPGDDPDRDLAEGYLLRSMIYGHPAKAERSKARDDYERAVALSPELKKRTKFEGL